MTGEEAKKEIIDMANALQLIPNTPKGKAVSMAIKALGQEPVLDKIRAEIQQLTSRYTISRERGGMGQVEWADRLIREDDILQIIDKYKAEVEPQESAGI